MGKNIYREKFEQMNLKNLEDVEQAMQFLRVDNEKLKLENAGLKERLRLVKIAASDGGE